MVEKLLPPHPKRADIERQDHISEVAEQNASHALPIEKLVPVPSIGASLHSVETNPYGSRPACFTSTAQECLFVLATTLAIGQTSIFIGAIVCITSYIGTSLHMSSAEVTCRVADLFGRRSMLLWSMITFTAGLLIAGFATNAVYMDVFCGLLGICSPAAVPPAIGILGAVYDKPSRRKNRAFACFSAGNPLGFVVGAFVSGIVMTFSTWRTVFWTICVIYGIFTIAAWWTVPKDDWQAEARFNIETLGQFDILGTFLVVAGIAIFTASLTLANDSPKGWKTSYVIVLLVLGIVMLCGFVYWQSVFKTPLMPLYVWKDLNFSLLIVILCLGFYGFANNIFWLTLYWQRLQHQSPIWVAIRLLPQAVGGLIVNVIAALIMHRVSNKILLIIGAVAYTISFALISAMPEDVSWWAFQFPALVLSVVGADLEFTVTNMYVMSSLPSEQQSVAGGLLNTVTRVSSSVGLGISTAVFTGTIAENGAEGFRSYQATFWVALAGAGLALAFLPFLTIGEQGAREKKANARSPL